MRPSFAAPRGVWVVKGAIAQLGERNTGSVEVSGSIPLSSTNKTTCPRVSNYKQRFSKSANKSKSELSFKRFI